MKFVFLIAAFNAFFFTALLFQKKPKALHDKILTLWLIYLGLFIGVYAFYSHELFTHFKLLSISLLSLFLLQGPFLYTYIQALISYKKSFSAVDLLHFLPFILFNIYLLAASADPDLAGRMNLEKISPGDHPPALFAFFLIITALSGTVYIILSFMLFRMLDINIFNNFSSSAGLDLYWIRKLVLVFGIVWTALIIISVIHHIFRLFSMAFCTDGLFLSMSVFVILIGYFGLKQRLVFTNGNVLTSEEAKTVKARYSGSRLTDGEARHYAGQLSAYMKTEKPFLNPDLSLPQLSADLNISSHYLSQVINEQFNLNFFDFVNGYRVEEFKQKVSQTEFSNYSLLGIAFECGFNSKSAFNRIFKQSTGLTPSQYRKKSIN